VETLYFADMTPGVFVINVAQEHEWGIGQVQSNINNRITVNFENVGKKTSEEASEIIKVVSKILRYGMQPKDQKALIEEIGDMQCMIDLIVEHKLITKTQIKNRIKVKSKKLKKWSNLWQKKLEK
jgi:phosphoribosyl-ATP pyrophosphohydrolase